MLSEKKSYLNAAATNLYELSEEEKIQLQCEARERYYLDMNSAHEDGVNEGIELMIQLNSRLMEDDRAEDWRRATIDLEYCAKLLREYGL